MEPVKSRSFLTLAPGLMSDRQKKVLIVLGLAAVLFVIVYSSRSQPAPTQIKTNEAYQHQSGPVTKDQVDAARQNLEAELSREQQVKASTDQARQELQQALSGQYPQ